MYYNILYREVLMVMVMLPRSVGAIPLKSVKKQTHKAKQITVKIVNKTVTRSYRTDYNNNSKKNRTILNTFISIAGQNMGTILSQIM